MASKQHRSPPGTVDGPAAKKARQDSVRVELNPADCNLDFDIDGSGLQGHALHGQGFAYCWSGARANVGITGGKYCFGCKIISEQAVDMDDTPSDQRHVCRIGISRGDDPVGNLGETTHSFGFGGTGKFSNSGKFSDYGAKFGIGDTIVCAVNLEDKPLASIGFSKNGKWLGIAKQFDATSRGLGVVGTPLRKLPWVSALFPHVMLKNVVVQLQFSVEDGLIPEEGYKPWNCAVEDGNMVVGPSFLSPKECEVLMMVGLPASGKTTWAEKWVKEHPEKRYVLLGTNLALEQMKVPGLLRKQNYGERFERLMDRATGIFNTLLARAAKTPRNYILDQTNVYKSARNRKLKSFVNYRKVAVVIFPTPDDLKIRADKRFREMGKEVPADAVNEMLANFVLPMSKDMPGSNESLDEVIFPELSRGEAQRYLDEMKSALRSSHLNAKREFSPYSRESSVQSFSSPGLMSKEAASAAGGHWLTPRPTAVGGHWLNHPTDLPPNHDYLNPVQVNLPYSVPGSSLEHRTRSSEAHVSLPSSRPYENHPMCERPPYQRGEHDPYGSYADSSPYSRNASERTPFSIGGTSSYQAYGEADSSRRLSFESPSSFSRPSYGYPSSTPPLHNRSPGAKLPDTQFSHADHNALFSHRPGAHLPGQIPHADNSSARLPPYGWDGPHQTTYGSSYAAPPPRPSPRAPPPITPPGLWYHR